MEEDDENISEVDGASEMESGDDSKADNDNDEDDNASETPVSDSDNEVDEEEDNYFLKESGKLYINILGELEQLFNLHFLRNIKLLSKSLELSFYFILILLLFENEFAFIDGDF